MVFESERSESDFSRYAKIVVLRIILWILTTEGTETQSFKEQSVSLRRLTLAY